MLPALGKVRQYVTPGVMAWGDLCWRWIDLKTLIFGELTASIKAAAAWNSIWRRNFAAESRLFFSAYFNRWMRF
jgi:hypothetical protein